MLLLSYVTRSRFFLCFPGVHSASAYKEAFALFLCSLVMSQSCRKFPIHYQGESSFRSSLSGISSSSLCSPNLPSLCVCVCVCVRACVRAPATHSHTLQSSGAVFSNSGVFQQAVHTSHSLPTENKIEVLLKSGVNKIRWVVWCDSWHMFRIRRKQF
jgi:hypothetical protein